MIFEQKYCDVRDTFFTKVVKGHKTIFMNFRLDSRGKDHSYTNKMMQFLFSR